MAVLTGPASEGAGPNWSSFLSASVAASLTAAPDLDAWHNSAVSTGIYAVVSSTLAEGFADKEIVVSDPNDFSTICTLGEAKDFERPPTWDGYRRGRTATATPNRSSSRSPSPPKNASAR